MQAVRAGVPASTGVAGISVSSRPSASFVHWTSRQLLVAVASVAAFWLAAAMAWPLSGAVVPWDSKNHFYPMLRHLGAALADGELPLWNPFHFGGHPAAADPQSLLFTPAMFLFGWLVPKPSMAVFDLVVFAHLLPGALAFPFLFRRRGWHPAGAVLAAMIFVLGGSASARLQHTGIIFGYGLFPLTFLLLEEALARISLRFAAAFAAAASLMLLGRDQVAFLCALSLLAVVVTETVRSGKPWSFLRQRIGVFAVMAVLGATILIVPVLLTLQFLGTSTRPSFGFGVAAMGSLPPASLATILFADVFGSLRWTYDYWGPDWHSLAEGTWTDRATNYLFVGTLPALLILWHGLAGRRLFTREFRFFLVFGLAVLVYALGRYTPAFSVVFDSLPGVSLYRRPADATFLLNVVLAIWGGYLVHRYVTDGSPDLAELRGHLLPVPCMALAVTLPVAAIAGALSFAWPAGKTGAALGAIAGGLIVAGAACLVLRRGDAGRHARSMAAALLVALTGAELVWRNAASAMNAEPAERYAVFDTLPPDQARGLAVLRAELAQRHAKGEHPRVEILGLPGGWQNASMVLGLENSLGYNPLRIADVARAIGPGENAVDPNLRHFPGTFRGYTCRLGKLLGLEYLVLDRPIERLPRHFPRLASATLLYTSTGMWIYRLPPAAPRAILASRLKVVSTEAVLHDAEMPEFDWHDTALLAAEDVAAVRDARLLQPTDADTGEVSTGSVEIIDHRRNAVSLRVQTKDPAVVVLHDMHYPGWEATVDGIPTRILKTNLLFRGVEVQPGTHQVEFQYRPFSAANLAAAAGSLVGRKR